MPENCLVFTVATNGYDAFYQSCIASQRRYARDHGYDFSLVRRPYFVWRYPANDSAWLKVALILSALARGYEWVLFVDADCEIRPSCPAFQSVEREGKSIYAADGFSGRFNSGVIIVRNTPESVSFFQQLLREAAWTGIPKEDQAPYENGHFIHFAKRYDVFQVLEIVWNNNRDVHLDDFIRHYSAPLLRPLYRSTPLGRFVPKAVRSITRVRNKLMDAWDKLVRTVMRRPYQPVPINDRLRAIHEVACHTYPRQFAPLPRDWFSASPTDDLAISRV